MRHREAATRGGRPKLRAALIAAGGALLVARSAIAEELAPDRDRYGWAVPDYVRLQSGGFMGMLTVGVGYSALRDVVNVTVTYGGVPAHEGNGPIQLFTATLTVRPLRFSFGPERRFEILPLYLGGGAMISSSRATFVSQPDHYPKGYYPPNAIDLVAHFGLEIAMREPAHRLLARQSLFVEEVTINQYLQSAIDNHAFHLPSAFSTAIGWRGWF